jgi:large subunit ribosomal protein L18
MKELKIKRTRIQRRIKRVRNKILRQRLVPRLSVFRSNRFIYAQIIDDKSGKTLISANEKEVTSKMTKIQKATEVGKNIAKAAVAKKIKNVIFDKGAYAYHGRIKALADGAREGGLVF